jgi:hypothetical protein
MPQPSLAALNEFFASYGATVRHAWHFDAHPGGGEVDLAWPGAAAVNLIPTSFTAGPTQHVATGLRDDDYGVQFAELGSVGMSAGNSALLEPGAGSVWMAGRARIITAPGGGRNLVGKRQSSANGYYVQLAPAALNWHVLSASTTVSRSVALSHAGADYFDFLAIADRASGLSALVTTLGDSGTVSIAALGAFTSTATFHVGADPVIHLSGASIVSFLCWGTAPGSLIADRVAARAALSSFLDDFGVPATGAAAGTTTADTIRDAMIARVRNLVPRRHARDRYRLHDDWAVDFREWCEANPSAALRRFSIRDMGPVDQPAVTNAEKELVRRTFEVVVAYPIADSQRYGKGGARDRDDMLESDGYQLNDAIGTNGFQSLEVDVGPATVITEREDRESGAACVFLVLELHVQFWRSMS